ncbi:MAG: lipopolysaccharide biosynthesis regulator YciM [Polaribacter sp.]|jgi:lipopolysaccharide biosynthesis regulator YciM
MVGILTVETSTINFSLSYMGYAKSLKNFILISLIFSISSCSLFSGSDDDLIKDPKILTQEERENLKKPVRLQDLAYGEILYDYYRGEELKSLTKILIAQKHDTLPHHKNRAELLSGAIYLNLGMLNMAKDIFDKLLTEKDLQNELLARINFYLNKLHYKQGDYTQAEKGLKKTYNQLSDRYRDESLIMLSNIALSNKNLDSAKQWLVKISEESDYSTYVRFNLGILWLQQGQLEQSLPFLERVYVTLEPTELQRTLQDKATLALGFYFLNSKQFEQANIKFKQVRLISPSTNKALLGLGWTFIEQGDYENALNHWLKLTEKDVRDLAVQEALLAIPYAFQKLDAMAESLEKYLLASSIFQTQIELVETIEERVSNGNLVENLVANLIASKTGSNGVGAADNQIADSKLFGDEYDYYIYELLAKNSFNQGFRNYQKLGALALILDYWESQLPMFSQMVSANQTRYQERLPRIENYLREDSNNQYERLYSQVQIEIDQLKQNKNMHLLANDNQKAIFKRLTLLQNRLKLIPTRLISDEVITKTKRAEGLLMWQFQENSHVKIWELEKVQSDISQELELLSNRKLSLESARAKASSRFTSEEQKVGQGKDTIRNLRKRIEQESSIQSEKIKQQILDVLEKRKATLQHFQLQSDLSIARLHEKALAIPEDE